MADDDLIQQVWNKGLIIPGYDPRTIRRDVFGNYIALNEYGLKTSNGWEIDHIIPKARGGSDLLYNLQPLFWAANRAKGTRAI